MMTTSFANPSFAAEPSLIHFKTAVLEPLLVAAAALFWVLALPAVAVSLIAVKIWEVMVALATGHSVRPNPLILRQGPVNAKALSRIAQAARV